MAFPYDTSVLVVDDEAPIRELVATSLSMHGYSCRLASDAQEALNLLAEQESALLITDVRMPGLSGLDLLERVRCLYPNLFVILLTGFAEVPTVVRAMRSGASDFLTKPIRIAELLERVGNALARQQEALAENEERSLQDRRLQQVAEQYQALTEGVLKALAATLETKHPETRAHSERVALCAVHLASALNLNAEEVKAIYAAGLLHDIGKVAVDQSVLDKPGKLDEAEMDQIFAHPVESARIVAPVALSRLTVDAIRHHHERYDGKGYPDHLAGEQIPLSARILAVCDAYDAMTSERAYKPALPYQEGYRRLREGSGKQWDPEIVEVFCTLDPV
jgi:putative nucleotidyltransferase with HDIG domain